MRVAAFILVSAMCAACARSAPAPIALARTIEMDGRTVAVQIALQPEHHGLAQRYLAAAEAAVRAAETWAAVDGPLRIDDPPFHAGVSAPGVIVLRRTPWWSTATAMAPELAVARAISLHALSTTIDGRRLPTWFIKGLAEYQSRQVVMALFSRENTSPGFAMLELRYWGGFVPRFIRIRLLPESDAEPVRAFRARRDADPSGVDVEAMEGKTVAVLSTLEHWVGAPVLNSIVADFLERYRSKAPTLQDFSRVASSVSGQDLSWLLGPAFDGRTVFDYGVESLTSVESADGQFDTRVTIARYGDGLFTGSSSPRVGPYESGKAVTFVVAFADGSRIRGSWDGRDERKTLAYRSPVPAVEAMVDPDRLIALDVNRTNNGITLAPATPVAARRWAAAWMVWLEHALLSSAALV